MEQKECRALILPIRIEIQGAGNTAGPGALNRTLEFYGTAEFFGSIGDVQSVQALHVSVVLFCFSDHVERAGGWVDHGSAGDADDRNDVALVADVRAEHYACTWSGSVGGVE